MQVNPALRNVKVLDVASTIITLQLDFENALAVSSVFKQPHMLDLKISPNAFMDPLLATTIETQVEFELDLPRMLDKS